MTTSDGLPDYAIGPLLLRAHRRAAEAFNSALTTLDIQGRHFGVLFALSRFGPMSQVRLAAHTGADKSAVVRMVDDLQSHGYVERAASPDDRRAAVITLTAAGKDAFHRAETIAGAVADDLLVGFDSEDRAHLKRLLVRFVTDPPE
ncbi:MarR family winged helix-turn-helix transcriptional regulator [Gordonia sp. DT30]|uniref:MarR family winged helix-turn-helix transcriptional regulator n=1 Tax=Gordonia sp. DT30 TaxID=3416546 RepID=UPI003CF4E904